MEQFGYETKAADGTVERTRLRLFRQLRRASLVERALEQRYKLRVGHYFEQLPSLEDSYARILSTLKVSCFARSVAAALPPLSPEVQKQLDAHAHALRAREPVGTSSLHAPRLASLEDPTIFRVGLEEGILSFVENYLGVPARYLGVDIKREIADAKENGIRVWHRDIEDHRMLKFIVYLSDVDEAAGPFEYLSLADTDIAKASLHQVWGDVLTAQVLESVVPATRHHRAVGARHSVIFFDPSRLLHRASPPTTRDRYSATFSFATRQPYLEYPHVTAFNRQFVNRWSSTLSPTQRAALLG